MSSSLWRRMLDWLAPHTVKSTLYMPDGSTHAQTHAPGARLHDSDYFEGVCPCRDYPCKWAIAGQEWIEARERRRGKLLRAYFDHHGEWPKGPFIDAIIAAEDEERA